MSDAWHVAILVTCQLDHHQFNIYREGGGTRELTQKLFCLISTDCKEGKGTIKVGSLHGCTGVSSSSSIIYSRKNSPYNFTYKVTFILRFFRYSGLLVHQFFSQIISLYLAIVPMFFKTTLLFLTLLILRFSSAKPPLHT